MSWIAQRSCGLSAERLVAICFLLFQHCLAKAPCLAIDHIVSCSNSAIAGSQSWGHVADPVPNALTGNVSDGLTPQSLADLDGVVRLA